MKKIILLALILAGTGAQAQKTNRLTYGTAIGTGMDMGKPASTPFTWQVTGSYNFNKRLSAGIGTGVSFYETPLVPVFADVKFKVRKPGKFTPFIGCSAGYGFAFEKHAKGGIYVNPSFGIRYAACRSLKLFLSLGYELQKLERLKRYENHILSAEFAEQLRHHLVSAKIGFEF